MHTHEIGRFLTFSISSDVDIDIIARQTAGKTGAELENMVNLAAIHSIKENKAQIGMFVPNFFVLICRLKRR